MTTGIVRFSVRNFRGVVELEAEPNGKSVTLRGKNGAGKSAAIDAMWWGLGGNVDGEVVRNGADRTEVEIVIDGYAVRRQQAKGKKPTLTVKSADGKASFNSPTALLAGFIGAIERRGFTSRPSKEQAEVLRKLAPGLDCGDIDGERARVYEERTGINRDAKSLRAQADGVVVPADVPFPGEEQAIVDAVDVAAIVERKADVARVKADNDRKRDAASIALRNAKQKEQAAGFAADKVEAARAALRVAEEELARADKETDDALKLADEAREIAAALVDPDTTAIDAEIAAAKEKNAAARRDAEEHNRKVRAAHQAHAEHTRAAADRAKLVKLAEAKEAESKRLTERIEKLDAEKAARIGAAKLPIAGIALDAGAVTFDDGMHGPVEVAALNSASRIKLDVAIASALGHRLIAVRDASLLDRDGRAEIDRFAAEHGVQLLAEVVTDGGALEAVIEEGAVGAAAQQEQIEAFE